MRLRPWRNDGVRSADRLDVRLREFPHDSRDLVVHVCQTTLLSRTVIIDRALGGPTIRIQNAPPSSDMPVLRV